MSYQTAVLHHVAQSIVDRLLDLKVRIRRGRMRKEEANSTPWPLIKQGLSGEEIKSVFGNHHHSYCTVKITLHKILKHSFRFSDLILHTVPLLKSCHRRRSLFLITGGHHILHELIGHCSMFHRPPVKIFLLYDQKSGQMRQSNIPPLFSRRRSAAY